jgi:hypothetical protein
MRRPQDPRPLARGPSVIEFASGNQASGWSGAGERSMASHSTSSMISRLCLGASLMKDRRRRRVSTASVDGTPSLLRTSVIKLGFLITHLLTDIDAAFSRQAGGTSRRANRRLSRPDNASDLDWRARRTAGYPYLVAIMTVNNLIDKPNQAPTPHQGGGGRPKMSSEGPGGERPRAPI